jgi:hypothetical protein
MNLSLMSGFKLRKQMKTGIIKHQNNHMSSTQTHRELNKSECLKDTIPKGKVSKSICLIFIFLRVQHIIATLHTVHEGCVLQLMKKMYIHIYIEVHMTMYIYIIIYVYIYIICIYICKQKHTHTHIYIYIHTYVRTYIHSCMHSLIHSFIHSINQSFIHSLVRSFTSFHFNLCQLTSFQLTNNSDKQTRSYSHVLFLKLPPRRVPGTTW